VVAVLAAAGLGAPAPAAEAAWTGLGTRADDGAVVTAQVAVDARTIDLTVNSPALRKTAQVRLLLPAHWASQPSRTWPQLWMLHGANEAKDYTSWTAFTDLEQFMAGRDVLTVLPSDGSGGMYSAEWNHGRPTGNDYETFHTVELPQILARGYRANGVRVVAGISIGGLGAIDYTARHPGLFRAAASYSGMLDTLYPGVSAFVDVVRLRAGTTTYRLWGDTVLNRGVWREHNPYDLLPRLHGVPLYVSAGDGSRGPLDASLLAGDPIEPLAQVTARRFVARAKAQGLPVTVHLYSGGTHTWPYWQREFAASWPMLAAGLGVPA
jgi:S-formylglutathione hydrolase FrmB